MTSTRLVRAIVLVPGALLLLGWLSIAPFHGFGAVDGDNVLTTARDWLAGRPIYSNPEFLYTPLAIAAAVPLAVLPPALAHVIWLTVKLGIVALIGYRLDDRRGLVNALLFIPFVVDLWLGNVNTLLVGAMFLAMRDGVRGGAALGIVGAIFPKPLLLPFGLWLLVRRRSAAAATVVAGLATTAVGVVAFGPAAYRDWVMALADGRRFMATSGWNHALTGDAPALALPVGIAAVVGLVLALRFGSERQSLTWAIAAGVLTAPYAVALALLPLLLVGASTSVLALGAVAWISPPLAAGGALLAFGVSASGARAVVRRLVAPRTRTVVAASKDA